MFNWTRKQPKIYRKLKSQNNILTIIVEKKNQAAVFSTLSFLYLFKISRQFTQIQPPLVKIYRNFIGTDPVIYLLPYWSLVNKKQNLKKQNHYFGSLYTFRTRNKPENTSRSPNSRNDIKITSRKNSMTRETIDVFNFQKNTKSQRLKCEIRFK